MISIEQIPGLSEGIYLLLWLALLDIWLELARDRRNFVEEIELQIVERSRSTRQSRDYQVDHAVERRLHRILLSRTSSQLRPTISEGGTTHDFAAIVFVAVSLHIPNDLMAEQLRYLRCLENKALHIALHSACER
jgi:hypothetical protein